MAHLFSPLTIRGITLRNRIALSPMCMYSCEKSDGMASDWHLAHYGARAAGGCGLVMTEATAVQEVGRISPQDLGLWNDHQIAPLKPVTAFIRQMGSVSAIQLAHAGRKSGTYRPWSPVRGYVPVEDGGWPEKPAPSPVAFREGAPVPQELSVAEIHQLVEDFVAAAARADQAGFDVVELHSAHGYLLHQFLSPISNRRTDEFGGDFAGRTKLHRMLVQMVREVWPGEKPLFMRISATDWVEGAWDIRDTIRLADDLAPLGLDLLDCSSGGSTMDAVIPTGPGYQVFLAEEVKKGSTILSGCVGQITTPEQANEIVESDRSDLVFIGRELLRNPHWANQAAVQLGQVPAWPNQYQWAVGN